MASIYMASGYARISMAKCFSYFYNSTIFLLQIQVIIYFLTYAVSEILGAKARKKS